MKKKGVSLIWALIMSTALLFIASTIANIIISESRMSIRMDDSSRAYAAAESGIEWGKTYVSNCPVGPCTYGPYYAGASSYTVKITGGNKIESTGSINGVNRKLEYTVTANQPLDSMDPTKGVSVGGSYTQQFDYWSAGGASDIGKIGLSNSDGSEAIYFESFYDAGSVYSARLGAKNGATVLNSQNYVQTAFVGMATPYILRVRIDYIDGVSAKMTVMKKNWDNSSSDYSCISPLLTLDLQSIGFTGSALTQFYFAQASVTSIVADHGSQPIDGDGDVYKFVSSSVYLDNMSTRGMTGTAAIPAKYHVLVTTASSGGSVTGNAGTYLEGATATITATRSGNNFFTGWSGDCSGMNTTVNVIMSTNKSCTATFVPMYPIYRFYNSYDHYYSLSSATPSGWIYEGVAFYAFNYQVSGTSWIEQFHYGPYLGHFYTGNATEVANLKVAAGWYYDGPAFTSFMSPVTGTTPIYRLYQKTYQASHFYTASAAERDAAVNSGTWISEGTGWYAPQ